MGLETWKLGEKEGLEAVFGEDVVVKRVLSLFFDHVDPDTVTGHRREKSVAMIGNIGEKIDGTEVTVSVMKVGDSYSTSVTGKNLAGILNEDFRAEFGGSKVDSVAMQVKGLAGRPAYARLLGKFFEGVSQPTAPREPRVRN